MKTLVIGASSGIGLETTKAALAAGHNVRAFARSAASIKLSNPRLEKHTGDALNSADVAAALEGVNIVIQALGIKSKDLFTPIRLFSRATQVLIQAMETNNVKRLIAVTGFGAGDSRKAIPCLHRLPFKLMLGRAYDDKDIQEQLIEDSSLDWTIVRPGILTNGRGGGRYSILVEPSQWRNGIIARSDVAHFLVQLITQTDHLKRKPVLVRI